VSWSYSGNPATSNLDRVRFLIGDTDTNDQQLSDEEINALLVENHNNPYLAAVNCCRALEAQYARKVTKSMGDISIQYDQLTKHYSDLARSLTMKATLAAIPPYSGGISVSDKRIDAQNTDLVQPRFRRGMHDEPGSKQ
jgi:hypothetical protein